MRRVLVGSGTPLGNFLKEQGQFCQVLSCNEAAQRLRPCHEIFLVPPYARRPQANLFSDDDGKLVSAVCAAAKRVIFLSSLNVYPIQGLPLDEDSFISPLNGTSYARRLGRLHWIYEQKIRSNARASITLRLANLFGPGFTTGLARHLLGQTASGLNRVAIHQWYPVQRLPRDIVISRYLKAPVINLSTEPLAMGAILDEFFSGEPGIIETPAPYSRIHTRYAEAFGGSNGYIMSAQSVIEEMRNYIKVVRHLRTLRARPSDKHGLSCPSSFTLSETLSSGR